MQAGWKGVTITRRAAFAGAACLAIARPSMAIDNRTIERIHARCESLARASDLSGAVLIVKDGRPVFRAAYGLRDREKRLPNELATRFNIASIGKLFTSLAIMRFVEAGRISLDQKLVEVWPDYPNRVVAQAVTIAQLLNHTAGLGNRSHLSRANTRPSATQNELLATFVNDPPDAAPGAIAYSNDGYVVLGALIERLSSRPYVGHIRETIFSPLGMTQTDFTPLNAENTGDARAYTRDIEHAGVWRDATITDGVEPTAAGGARSTVENLTRFGEAMRTNRLLSAALMREWTTGRIDFNVGRYGYGMSEEVIDGHRIIGHSGGHIGIAGELMVFADQGITCALLTNGDVDGYWDAANAIKRDLAGTSDRLRNYDFTRTLIDTLARDPRAGRALYAARGYRKPRESVIDVYGFKFIHQGRAEQGMTLLRFNVETFDTSTSLWSLAEGLRITGHRTEALAAYRAYLAREPGDADTEKRIAELSKS